MIFCSCRKMLRRDRRSIATPYRCFSRRQTHLFGKSVLMNLTSFQIFRALLKTVYLRSPFLFNQCFLI